jgi:hypothetical protein
MRGGHLATRGVTISLLALMVIMGWARAARVQGNYEIQV